MDFIKYKTAKKKYVQSQIQCVTRKCTEDELRGKLNPKPLKAIKQ